MSESGEDFDFPQDDSESESRSSDSSSASDNHHDRQPLAETLGSMPTKEDYEAFIKSEQIKNDRLQQALRTTKAELADTKAKLLKDQHSGRDADVKVLGHAFFVHKLFLPSKLSDILRQPKLTTKSIDQDRYRTEQTKETGLLAEIYEESPSSLQPWISHSFFISNFDEAHKAKWKATFYDLCKKILPLIFTDTANVATKLAASYDRSTVPKFQKLLRDPDDPQSYAKHPPLLYPNGKVDPTCMFMTPELALALKGILLGPASLSRTDRYARPKTNAERYAMKQVTAGAIACVAVMNEKRPFGKTLYKFYNHHIFLSTATSTSTFNSNEDAASDSEDLIEQMNRVALDVDTPRDEFEVLSLEQAVAAAGAGNVQQPSMSGPQSTPAVTEVESLEQPTTLNTAEPGPSAAASIPKPCSKKGHKGKDKARQDAPAAPGELEEPAATVDTGKRTRSSRRAK
ncbi:hypothetical protein DXG03_008071 [Asterophora parasitica]|uniref:Uncharacterized protein n=1 Tax=Asterophora parasitica TaxID=117018 RepID=A0A9P7G0K4_9AGAR|nr:hypothetical protein DXG03_008071 [Asterophora parasitica]